MSYFTNKVVWITGATSGIGRALAKSIAPEGAILVLSARRKELLLEVSEECTSLGAVCHTIPVDVTDHAGIEAAKEEIITKYSKVDVLINNAGISQRGYVKDTIMEVDRKIMEVNYFGNIAMTKAVLSHMMGRNSGQIVVISSFVGHFGFKTRSSYAASKHALHGFYDSLYIENQKTNIKVNIICPGRINTNISLHSLEGNGKEHGVMDDYQAEGMTADAFAKRALRAIKADKRVANIGKMDTLMIYFKKFLPWLFYAITKRIKDR